MTIGKTIRIYLADGTPLGIRHAELVNWSGQAFVCPRGRVAELQAWPDHCHRPGVYILVGENEADSREQIYIGEAENVWLRLQSHLRTKEFWTRVVFFTSKDDNITKAHVKYLEARLVELALEANRVQVENGTSPQRPALPRADRDAMEEFLGPALTLLGTLGFPFLQPVAQRPIAVGGASETIGQPLFFKAAKRVIDARGAMSDEGFVVYSGSIGDSEVRSHLGKAYRERREALLADGSIQQDGDKIRFTRDVLFTSPSAAAATLAGGAYNGREAWKTQAGQSLKELEEAVGNGS
jgi:hypothetical protein